MNDIVVLGAGGYGREVAQLIKDINADSKKWNLIGYIDEDPGKKGLVYNGDSVLGGLEWFERNARTGRISAVCGMGSPHSKQSIIKRCKLYGLEYVNLIHPKAIVSSHVDMGAGVVVCAQTVISINTRLGNHVALNPNCGIGHDTVIMDYTSLLWNVTISGNVIVNEGCMLGSGSAVIQQLCIGCWSVIGAGAVVVKDIPERCTAVGVPAKPI